jgi:ribosomal protein L21E
MDEITPQSPEREIDNGDRVHIRQGGRPIPAFLGRAGTVVEVFRVPCDSCLVRIDGDPNRQRKWFFYRDEVVISEA